jgi:hypothetical protein
MTKKEKKIAFDVGILNCNYMIFILF